MIQAVDERLQAGIDYLGAYYRRVEGLLANVLRDKATMAIVGRLLAFYRDYSTLSGKVLMVGRDECGRERRRILTEIGHATALATGYRR